MSLVPSCEADRCPKVVKERGGNLLSPMEGNLSPVDEALVAEATFFKER